MKEYTDIYDSHAHYDSTAFDGDRARLLEEDLPLNRVRCVINMGTRIRSCAASIGLAGCNPYFFTGVGIHPSEIDEELPENWLDCLRQWLEEPKVVAIGEIGLDYYGKDNAPAETQKAVFHRQMELAQSLNLPVIVHDREAHHDCLEAVRAHPGLRGVYHCYSGSLEDAKVLVGLGCAPIYPCVIHSTPDHFGADKSQAVIGVQMASAYVGSCLMPPLFGLIAHHISPDLLQVYSLVFITEHDLSTTALSP